MYVITLIFAAIGFFSIASLISRASRTLWMRHVRGGRDVWVGKPTRYCSTNIVRVKWPKGGDKRWFIPGEGKELIGATLEECQAYMETGQLPEKEEEYW